MLNRPQNFQDGRAKALRKTLPERQDLGDSASVKKRDDVEKMIAQQEKNDIREIMNIPHGRRFVWRMLQQSNIIAGVSHVADDPNGRQSAYLDGIKAFGKWVNDHVAEAARDNYLLMWQENFLGE